LDTCRRLPPRVAVVLGSGMGDLAMAMAIEIAVPYCGVPDLEPTTVEGHKGELRLGTWADQRVLVFAGRLHYYEGHPWRQIEEQVAVARSLGAEILLLTNAAGGIRPDLEAGSLVPIRDHLEWTRSWPWRQPETGERVNPYSQRLVHVLVSAGTALGLTLIPGVYAQVTGPCYETPAEIRALRSCGADVVGMSTAREVNRGRELGMECAAVSCVTNRAAGLGEGPIHHDEVLKTGTAARDLLARLVEGFLRMV
jgi:purine-nucleoside phosphorylase